MMLSLLPMVLWSGSDFPPDHVLYRVKNIEVQSRRFHHEDPQFRDLEYVDLLRGKIDRGYQFRKPKDPRQWGKAQADFSRLATTYYHRQGPAGVVMERWNWFGDATNSYASDLRLVGSLAGLASAGPFATFPALWSEPPVAVVNMYAGTLASYARPLQRFDFYENDDAIVQLSLPKKGEGYFTYIRDAQQRGAFVNVFHGDERTMLAQKAPQRFYQVMFMEICPRDLLEDISVNLLTKEAMTMLFDKLAPRGILCVHVSNRYFDLAPVIGDVAESLGYACLHGHDQVFFPGRTLSQPFEYIGHYTSSWVVVARKAEHLTHLEAPRGHADIMKRINDDRRRQGIAPAVSKYWSAPERTGKNVWTDKTHSLLSVMFQHPASARLNDGLREIGRRWENLRRNGPRFYYRP
jgi:hypothetical protein